MRKTNATTEHHPLVIATGGGLMMNPANVAALQRTGQIFCLTASPEEILDRISRQPGTRPLLQDPNPLAKITELLAQRAPTYNQFSQVSTTGGDHRTTVAKLLALIDP